ncbi:hypothetical protein PCASD_06270 [Puccinia coronata f. sp. avenae]|uniref:Uncharacterized protein n=1 Tax=Puccinia coronata f. sp. avenae TaxID=200324 RepID=A0A2N5V6F3_9BASI|nr:hypothetical protein PCASD_06270 [Puccinia coronata f. sp. avenae]
MTFILSGNCTGKESVFASGVGTGEEQMRKIVPSNGISAKRCNLALWMSLKKQCSDHPSVWIPTKAGLLQEERHVDNTGPGNGNGADAFMHALCDELMLDDQGALSRNQVTILGPDHRDGQDQE